MPDQKPPVVAELIWSEERRFDVTSAKTSVVVDGNSVAGPSPVQLLAIGLAACMSIDVVDIIRTGRYPLSAFRATVVAHRLAEHPHRLTQVHLQFAVRGAVPDAAVQRAIDLSRDRYCSVWHSLRQDITLTTSFGIEL